jgi:hypothetical protein
MSTVFLRVAIMTVLVAACGRSAQPLREPVPAAPSADTTAARSWQRITVDGPYGTFAMAVPVISISPAEGASSSIMLDSVALREVEKRLTARIAGIARAQASALLDSVSTAPRGRNPAPVIRAGLLGEIVFATDSLLPTAEGARRVVAIAAMLLELPGRVEISTVVSGLGAARFDVANARARRVYLALVEAEPSLAEREVLLTVRTRAMLPGAPVPHPVVEVYYTPQ